VNGIVYIAWGSHEDATPWYGWIIGYSFGAGGFTQSAVLNTTPDGGGGGVWMGGGAPAADASGNLYAITGNGAFDVTNSSGPTSDYGDSFLQLSGGLHISSWFTPTNQAFLAANDFDFGAGGAALVLNLSTGPLQHLVIGGGKNDVIYVVNGDSMGGYGDGNVWQEFYLNNHVFSTAAFWNNTLYIATKFGPLLAYAFDSMTDMFNTTPTSQSPTVYGLSGASPSVSASGVSSNGIVWGIDSTNYCPTPTCGPAVLRAYDATNLATELWNSSMVGSDAAGNAVKFTVPTVANGRVYVGTRGNNTGGVYGSTSISGELDVYGLKPD